VFSGFSNIIQNDLNEAIGDMIRYDMSIKEASAAPFVSAEVDESQTKLRALPLCG